MGLPWRDHESWELIDEASDIAGRDVGALLCDADVDELKERFPNLRVGLPIVLRYQTGANVPPLRVGIAVIDPLVQCPAE